MLAVAGGTSFAAARLEPLTIGYSNITATYAPLWIAVEEQVGIKRLGYRSPTEMLAEKFHMDRRLLTALNPQAAFEAAGS